MPSLNTAPYSRGEVMRSSARSIPVSFNQSVLPHQYRGFGCFFFLGAIFCTNSADFCAWKSQEMIRFWNTHTRPSTRRLVRWLCSALHFNLLGVLSCFHMPACVHSNPSINQPWGKKKPTSSTKNSSCRLSHGWCVLLEQLRLNCWSQTPGRLVYRAIQGGTGCKTYRVQYPFSICHGIRQRVVMRHVDAQLCYQISFGFSRLLLTIVFEEQATSCCVHKWQIFSFARGLTQC